MALLALRLVLLGAVSVAASVGVATVDSLALRFFAWRCGLLSLLHVVALLGLWCYESLRISVGTRLISTAQASSFLLVLFLVVMLVLGRGTVAWRRWCATCLSGVGASVR